MGPLHMTRMTEHELLVQQISVIKLAKTNSDLKSITIILLLCLIKQAPLIFSPNQRCVIKLHCVFIFQIRRTNLIVEKALQGHPYCCGELFLQHLLTSSAGGEKAVLDVKKKEEWIRGG